MVKENDRAQENLLNVVRPPFLVLNLCEGWIIRQEVTDHKYTLQRSAKMRLTTNKDVNIWKINSRNFGSKRRKSAKLLVTRWGTVLNVMCSVVALGMLRLNLLNRIRASLSYLFHCYCFTVFFAVSYNVEVISEEIFSRSWVTNQVYVGMFVFKLCSATDMNRPAGFSEVCTPNHLPNLHLKRHNFWTFLWQ